MVPPHGLDDMLIVATSGMHPERAIGIVRGEQPAASHLPLSCRAAGRIDDGLVEHRRGEPLQVGGVAHGCGRLRLFRSATSSRRATALTL